MQETRCRAEPDDTIDLRADVIDDFGCVPMRAVCLRSYVLGRAICHDLRADLAEYKIKNTMTAC